MEGYFPMVQFQESFKRVERRQECIERTPIIDPNEVAAHLKIIIVLQATHTLDVPHESYHSKVGYPTVYISFQSVLKQ
jgi:hypothetical protein